MTRTRAARNRNSSRSRRRLLPRPRILLGTLMVLLFVAVLVVQAYINAEFRGDHVESEVGDQSGVPAEIRNARRRHRQEAVA